MRGYSGDQYNYGIQTEAPPTQRELDARWIRIVSWGVARAIVLVVVIGMVLGLMGYGLYDAVTGPAVCEGQTCAEALK